MLIDTVLHYRYEDLHMNTIQLTIVMPVFNEEKTLKIIMQRVFRACGDIAQCVFVDDGSTDSSLAILRELARPQDTVLTKKNEGKGSAVRLGYKRAKGEYTVVQDADLEYSPEEIPELLQFAQEGNHRAVFGSRRLKKQKQFVHFVIYVGGTLLTYICNFLFGVRLTDQPTCYKMVRTDVLKTIPLKENDFRFDPELTCALILRGIPIVEYPISYMPRSIAEGKKIGWKDWFLWVYVFMRMRCTGK